MPTGIYIRTDYHKKISSDSHKGKKFSKDTINKMKISHIGKVSWCKGLTKENSEILKNAAIKRSGKLNHNYREVGSIRILKGYKFIKILENLWIKEHRYVVEQYIGRKLKRTEIVHHIDGNTLNNFLNNLYVFKNNESHTAFETLVRNKLIDRYYFKSNLDELKEKLFEKKYMEVETS